MRVEPRNFVFKTKHVADLVYALQLWLERFDAFGFNLRLVHAGAIVISNFLLVAR